MRVMQRMSSTRTLSSFKLLSSALCLSLAFNLTAWGRQAQAPAPARVVAPVAVEKAVDDGAGRRRRTFEIVWQAVKDHHFDPRFGGVDWDAVRSEFAPLAERSASDGELHALLQRMLDRLGQSHFVIIPPESIASAGEDEADESAEGEDETDAAAAPPARPHGAEVAEHLSHGVRLDLRIINGAPVITEVEPSSAAARAGLRPGFVVRSVDGHSMRRALRRLKRRGAYQPVVLRQIPEELLIGYFNGPPGTTVRVTYLDARNRVRAASLTRERLKGELSPPLQSLPPQFVRFESKRLANNIGYIRFNYFVGPVMDKFCAALRSMRDAPGLVIDLRGNRGGVLGMISGIGGLLETRGRSYGVMRTRAGSIGFGVHPQRSPYTGQLVVLIDGSSLSASEILAAGLQESGRAVVVGERSAGATLPSVARELPTGAVLQYAFADFVTADGNRIEGTGVRPHVVVPLDRRSLLAGRDPQLAAAVDAIRPNAPADAPVGNAAAAPAQAPRDPATGETAASGEAAGGSPEPPASAVAAARAAEVIEKYVRAVGGREAVERISSRVSKGTFEGNFAGVKVGGTVEIIEKAPNKSVSLVKVAETGVMRRGYTGRYAYEQVPYYGFRVLEGAELADLVVGSDLHWSVKLPRLYPHIKFVGTEKDGDAELLVLELAPRGGSQTRLYFDAKTGLLTRKDDTTFEDYREVEGVLMPFTQRTAGTVFKLTEIKFNLPVDDDAFLEAKDCFTKQ